MKQSGKKLVLSVALAMAFAIVLSMHATALSHWDVLKQADTAAKQGQYAQALKSYEQVVVIFKQKKDWVNTAVVYGRMGRCAAAIDAFDQAAQYWKNEAALWDQLGKKEDKQVALRKANAVSSTVSIFLTLNASEARKLGVKNTHQAIYEPEFGTYIGAYAEADPAVHNPYSPDKRYQTEFPKLTGKTHAAYLIYFRYGDNIHKYDSHLEKSKLTGVAMQIGLEPFGGMKQVKQDEWLTSFVKHLDSYNMPIFLRFANEMNEPSAPWFGPAKEYVPVFRMVSDTVKANSKNIAMCWAPAWFPPDTVDAYYPGDGYVDWVGLSMYRAYNPQLDPLGKGVDRESYLQKLDRIYKTYAAKKPIYIAEGGVSYTDIKSGKDYTNWAVKEIQKFYAYLPMLYPKVKAVFWFDNTRVVDNIPRSYRLSDNTAVLKAYSEAIANPIYLSHVGDVSDVYYQQIENGKLPELDHEMTVSAYVKTVDPNVDKVIFLLDNKPIAEDKSLPYTLTLSKGQIKASGSTLTVKAVGMNGKILTQKEWTLH